jgi:hypothetical protein
MSDLDEPGDVADQIHVPGVANSQTGLSAMAAKLALADHLAE